MPPTATPTPHMQTRSMVATTVANTPLPSVQQAKSKCNDGTTQQQQQQQQQVCFYNVNWISNFYFCMLQLLLLFFSLYPLLQMAQRIAHRRQTMPPTTAVATDSNRMQTRSMTSGAAAVAFPNIPLASPAAGGSSSNSTQPIHGILKKRPAQTKQQKQTRPNSPPPLPSSSNGSPPAKEPKLDSANTAQKQQQHQKQKVYFKSIILICLIPFV